MTGPGYRPAVLPPGLLAPFIAAPERAVVVTDFDGTLSPIVADPATAAPFPGVVDAVHALAGRYRTVAVVSGRPASFLRDRLELDRRPPSALVVSGLYGLERIVRGELTLHPAAAVWRDAVTAAATEAEAEAPEGVGVERKGLALTLHFRTAPEHAEWVSAWAREAASRHRLALHEARMSFELRPPVKVDKGTVVDELIGRASAACFLGDDVGDLPAFDALDRLAGADPAATCVRVGVRSEEAPVELMDRADVIVDGPAGSLAMLRQLADA
jgi:trehalose 6-phosphate phosphatase